MGYTGSGINKRRAHVHVELNMVLNPLIAPWQSPSAFNGQNMVGIDVVGWLTVNARDPRSKLSDFILQSEPHWKLIVPNRTGELEIVRRHPWLRKPGSASESWEITFAANALPLAVSPSAEPAGPSRVVWVKPFIGEHRWVTREMLSGSGSSAGLTSHGAAFVKLITGDP
jgi:hypothetical protein